MAIILINIGRLNDMYNPVYGGVFSTARTITQTEASIRHLWIVPRNFTDRGTELSYHERML